MHFIVIKLLDIVIIINIILMLESRRNTKFFFVSPQMEQKQRWLKKTIPLGSLNHPNETVFKLK
jgi:hypothetical protein